MGANNPVIKDRASVYFYQYGYIEKPWDQVSHGYDIIGLFGYDIEWVNGGVKFSEEFVAISQKFFGDYIKGQVDESLSVQNGYYVQIVDEVKKVPMNDLDVVKERCEVYKLFGDSIWRNEFCMGIYPSDVGDWEDMAEQWAEGIAERSADDAGVEGGVDSADKQEM